MVADFHQYYSKLHDHQSFRTQILTLYLFYDKGRNLSLLPLLLLKQNQGLKTVLNKFCSKRVFFKNYEIIKLILH